MDKKPRHYTKSPQAILRTHRDLPRSVQLDRARSFDFLSGTDMLAPKPARPSIVNSADGKLTGMLLVIPAYAFDGSAYWDAYVDLIPKMPEHTHFLILAQASIQEALSQWLTDKGIIDRAVIGAVPNHLNVSVWAEDAYAITQDEGGNTFFAEPFSFPRYADSLVAEMAANLAGLNTYQAPLYFQGGNILIGDDFFFIGADYPTNSLDYVNQAIFPEMGESDVQLVNRLYQEYLDTTKRLSYIGSKIQVPTQISQTIMVGGEPWQETLYLGNNPGTVQPMFHIDMFMSLAGRNQEGRYQILVGDPRMAAELINFPESLAYAMPEVFDNIAFNLARNPAFEVIRNPLPLIYTDDERYRRRIWYFATANNCLVEIDGNNKTVWLPTYGHGVWPELAVTDQANKAIWEGLGFEAVFLADFHPFAENLGAVHCISKYLGREATPPIV